MLYEKRNFLKFKGVVFCGAFLLLFHFMMSLTAQAQYGLSELRVMWRNGSYSEVIPLLLTYRESPHGRNAEVDYMIATSACRTSNLKEDGYKFFRWILYHYSLDERSRELVENEMRQCDPSNRPIIIAFVTQRSGSGVAGVRGKTYHWLDAENAPLMSDPVKVVREIPLKELRGRLFEISDRATGVRHMKKLLGSRFKVESVGHFILASSSPHTQSQLRDMGRSLEKVLHFFASQYKMPIPRHLITVYMVPNTRELQRLAEKIHGIMVSEASIGYSFRDDLSIVGVIPRIYTGTLRHELFHLMVRNNFGDVPPWMDEGIAALYEVSEIVGDGVIGKPNWRGQVLERFWKIRPSIKELVKMDWRSFDNMERDFEAKQQAANHAMARYFILYLQNKQKLAEVCNTFRIRKVQNVKIDPGTDAVHLLESVLQPLSEVDKDFTKWFNSLHRIK